MIDYAPRPGSIPARVIAHLAALPAGTELATAVLADELDLDAACVPSCLEYAVKNGMLARDKRGHRIFWSLGNGEVVIRESAGDAIDDDPIVQRIVSASATNMPPSSVRKPARSPSMSSVPRPLRVALWSDGQLQIQRGDFELILLAPDETRELVRYLERLGERVE